MTRSEIFDLLDVVVVVGQVRSFCEKTFTVGEAVLLYHASRNKKRGPCETVLKCESVRRPDLADLRGDTAYRRLTDVSEKRGDMHSVVQVPVVRDERGLDRVRELTLDGDLALPDEPLLVDEACDEPHQSSAVFIRFGRYAEELTVNALVQCAEREIVFLHEELERCQIADSRRRVDAVARNLRSPRADETERRSTFDAEVVVVGPLLVFPKHPWADKRRENALGVVGGYLDRRYVRSREEEIHERGADRGDRRDDLR